MSCMQIHLSVEFVIGSQFRMWVLNSCYACIIHPAIVLEQVDSRIVIPTTGVKLVKVGVFPDQEPIAAVVLTELVPLLFRCL